MTEDPEARVAQLFDAVADTYDAVGVDFFEPIAAGLVAELAPRSRVSGPSTSAAAGAPCCSGSPTPSARPVT